MKEESMENNDLKNRFSVYSIWQELNRAICEGVEKNKDVISSYTSPITISCMKWMGELGNAILRNDQKTINKIIFNMNHYTVEVINDYSGGKMPGVTEEWMRPYYEFYQAQQILNLLLDESLK
jgi:hypothetical protein